MENKKISLSSKEKIELTSGANMWEFQSFKGLSNSRIRCSDGPTGIRYVKDTNLANDNSVINTTCFLSPSSAANTFNPELMYKLGTGLGKDAKYKKIDLLLAPGINIKRSPLCGRNFEYFSEDPFLTGLLASALVNGIQSQHVGVCIKHLACNNQEDFRYTNNSIIDERAANEIYMNPFRIVIEKSNPLAVMTSYNKVNDMYISENKDLLNKMRNDYNFRGLFISDWGGVNDPVKAFKAGLNIEMPGNSFSKQLLEEAYQNNVISDEELDKNTQIIHDNFETIYNNRKEQIEYNSEEIKNIAYEAAKEAPVLLKNTNNVLPLKGDENILVVGSLFEHPNTQGFGSSRLNYEPTTTFKDEFLKFNDKFTFKRGYSLDGSNSSNLRKECISEAHNHSKIVMFMGYIYDDCEGKDRKDISLPEDQIHLLRELLNLGKQIIVVLNTGSAVSLPYINRIKGILQSGLLGEVHEKVITEILFGKINPSGKLSETYPIKLKDNPLILKDGKNYNQTLYKESLYVGYRYYDSFKKEVNFPFGYGLSYSTFKFTNLEVIKEDKYRFVVSFIVENTSDIEGSEVCQIYVRKKTSNTYHSYQQLKGFKKIKLAPKEKQTVQIILEDHTFEFYNDNSHKFEIESGVYEICVGNSSRNIELVDFINIEGNESNLRFKIKDLSSYYRYKNIEDFEFQKLLGFEIKKIENNEFNFNSTLFEIKDTFLGKRIYNNVKKQYLGNYDFFPKEIAIEMMDFLPIRMLVTMSNGALPYEFAKEIIYALNSNVIKGGFHLIKCLKKLKEASK